MRCSFSLFILGLVFLTFTAQGQSLKINTVAGNGTQGYSGDGNVAANAEFDAPLCVTVDSSGNYYIVDFNNFRVRKVNTAGIISTIAGNGINGDTGDGTLGTSGAVCPHGVVADRRGNIFISDASFSVIRKINALGFISTYAGNKLLGWGFSGDGHEATTGQLNQPFGLATDMNGSLYIADAGNHVIRKVDTLGRISTVAGVGGMSGYFGDGSLATFANLDSPAAVAVDRYKNIYITDYLNNVIRRVDSNQVITTYAGNGVSGVSIGAQGYSGDNGPASNATLRNPKGLAVDTAGNLYIADADNNVVRMVNIKTGIITTVIGDGTEGFGGDLNFAIGCNLHNPYGVAVDAYGNIYVADANNARIRKTYPANVGVKNVMQNAPVQIYPNPFTNSISVSGLAVNDQVCIYDLTGRAVGESRVAKNTTETYDLGDLATGIYMLQVSDHDGLKKNILKLVKE
jgi:streptogramin lyase